MSLSCECCVLSGRGFCDGPITHTEDANNRNKIQTEKTNNIQTVVCILLVFVYATLMMVAEATETCWRIVIYAKTCFIDVHLVCSIV